MVTLATSTNGLTLTAQCGTASVILNLETTDLSDNFQASGTQFTGGVAVATHVNGGTTGIPGNGPSDGNIDVIARNSTFPTFARVDAHASFGSPCTFWAMITPSG